MSHEIESDFRADWDNEITQCQNCTSFENRGGRGFCKEAKGEVPFSAHCDFFQSRD